MQKKTGRVAGDVKDDGDEDGDDGAGDDVDEEDEKPKARTAKAKASKTEKTAKGGRKRAASLSPLTGEESGVEAKLTATPEAKNTSRGAKAAKLTSSKPKETKAEPKSANKISARDTADVEPSINANKRRKTAKTEKEEVEKKDEVPNGLDADMDTKGRRRSGRISGK